MAKKKRRRRVSKAAQEQRKHQQKLLLFGVSAAAVLIVVVLVVLSSLGRDGKETTVAAAATKVVAKTIELESGMTPEGYPYLGSPDAPVKMIEYSDYFCNHCSRFALEKAPQIEEEYVATGKLQYIVQYYALEKDERLSVVEAGACAADQGHFFEYQRLLFANQRQLGSSPPDQWRDLLVEYAQQLGLNVTTFETCWDQGQHQGQVLASIDEVLEKGISSTPSFLIGGKLLVGNQPYETFQAAIEEALAEATQ